MPGRTSAPIGSASRRSGGSCRISRLSGTRAGGAQQLYDAYVAAGLTLDEIGRRHRRIHRVKALMDDGAVGQDLRRQEPASDVAAVA